MRLPDHQASWLAAKSGVAPLEQIEESGIDRGTERRSLDSLFADEKRRKDNGKYF